LGIVVQFFKFDMKGKELDALDVPVEAAVVDVE
jgi:hypothetical protein